MKSFNYELSNRPDKRGKYPVLMRITENRKHKRIALGYSIEKKYFNKKKGGITTSCPDYKQIQDTFDVKMAELKALELEANKKHQTLSLYALKNKAKENKFHSFFSFAEKLQSRWKHTKSVNHVKHVDSVLKNLKGYVNNRELYFEDFSVSFLRDLEAFYKGTGNSNSTARNKLKIIRSVFKEAEREDLIAYGVSPFLKFSLPKMERNKKEKLSVNELRDISKLKLKPGSLLWHSRNAFLFSFFSAGIRVSDMLQMKWKNIEQGRLRYRMMKSKKNSDKIIDENALSILKLYWDKNCKAEDFIFPFFKSHFDYSDKYFLDRQISSKTAMYNSCLKDIGKLAGIEKRISSHIARHSFASIAIKNNSPSEVQGLLEHEKLETTENYLASLGTEEKDSALIKALQDF